MKYIVETPKSLEQAVADFKLQFSGTSSEVCTFTTCKKR